MTEIIRKKTKKSFRFAFAFLRLIFIFAIFIPVAAFYSLTGKSLLGDKIFKKIGDLGINKVSADVPVDYNEGGEWGCGYENPDDCIGAPSCYCNACIDNCDCDCDCDCDESCMCECDCAY